MINGCNNTTQKLIVEDKISTDSPKRYDVKLNNEAFVRNKIIKKKIIPNKKENYKKQENNDVIFEFRNERLLQGRNKSDFEEKKITKKALSAVFNMLNQNLSSENKSILDNDYFNKNKASLIYKNILVFLPLSGSFANFGTKIRKALDISIMNFSNGNIKITYIDTGKSIDKKEIRNMFNNLKPNLILGPFRREILLSIKPIAKTRSIPILTFSNDIAMIENNIWSLGFSPEEQVESVISCALSHGYKNFGLIAPDNLYGKIIINASLDLISNNKTNNYDKVFLSNEQLNNKTKLFSILKRFLKYTEYQTTHSKYDAILISGSKLS